MAQLSLFGGRRQRGVKPDAPKEFQLQCMVAATLTRWGNRGWMWSHLPFGEHRNPITGARLKRMGVKRGWPDFELLSPYPPKVHFLELKRRGFSLTDDQQNFQMFCVANGYTYAVADNYADAVAYLKDWGAVKATVAV